MTLLAQPQLKAGSTARQPSAFWPTSEILSVMSGDQDGIYLFEDFECVDTTVSSNVGKLIMRSGGWRSREDTSCSILQLTSDTGGVLRLLTDATDNNEVYLQAGGAAGTQVQFDKTLHIGRMFFEVRFRIDTIVSRDFFFGLSEETRAVADEISDSDAMADKDFFGFRSMTATPTVLDAVHNVASGGGFITNVTGLGTLVASTWYKAGFVVNYASPDVRLGRFFFDGVESASYLTRTVHQAATFPDAQKMGILLGAKNATTTATTLDIDWVRLLWLPTNG